MWLVLSSRTIKVEVYDWDRDGRWVYLYCRKASHVVCCALYFPSRLVLLLYASHDFIGDFTTSYRELARGQSQFNVYEVSNFSAFTLVWWLLRYRIPVRLMSWILFLTHLTFLSLTSLFPAAFLSLHITDVANKWILYVPNSFLRRTFVHVVLMFPRQPHIHVNISSAHLLLWQTRIYFATLITWILTLRNWAISRSMKEK